MQISYRECY